MTEQKLVSLQEMQARFEHLKGDELEIACEVTIPVTISVYRGTVDGSMPPPLYCGIQFQGEEDASYTTTLLDQTGEIAHTLEAVSEAFGISIEAKIWEITAEDEPEDTDTSPINLSAQSVAKQEPAEMYHCKYCGNYHPVAAKEYYCPLDPGKPM